MNLFSYFKKKRKAQAEIVGITIVMVLIMLGIVFVIRFVILPSDVNVKGIYEQTQTASNFVDSMLKTTTNCNSRPITELIQDCVEYHGEESFQYLCSPDLDLCPGGCRSCVYLNRTIGRILEKSLDEVKVNYDLYICKWDEFNLVCDSDYPIISAFSSNSCLAQELADYDSKQTPIPTDVGNRVVQMYIC